MENAGYSVKCVKCEEDGIEVVMHGETGRCARVRCCGNVIKSVALRRSRRAVHRSGGRRELCISNMCGKISSAQRNLQ